MGVEYDLMIALFKIICGKIHKRLARTSLELKAQISILESSLFI